jgi:hypothetical protein
MATLEVRHGEVFIILTDNCCEHCGRWGITGEK